MVELIPHQVGALERVAVGLRRRAQHLREEVPAHRVLRLAHGLLLEHDQGRHRRRVVDGQLVQHRQGMVAGHNPDVAIDFAPHHHRRHHALHGHAQLGQRRHAHRPQLLRQFGVNAVLE